ncbi:unnamed protein product, partial [marine sediment metagenome]
STCLGQSGSGFGRILNYDYISIFAAAGLLRNDVLGTFAERFVDKIVAVANSASKSHKDVTCLDKT